MVFLIALQEKILWMNQIRFARARCTLRSKELPSSLEIVEPKPSTPPSSARTPLRKATSPSPISPATENVLTNPPTRRSSLGALTADVELLRLLNPALAFIASTTPDAPTGPMSSDFPPTVSTPVQLKNLLEGDVSTILIRRASTNHRRMVDQSLHDVFFEECQGVRVQAQMKNPLFQPPKLTTESGSIAARNKMTRRGSVLLKRQRSVADSTSIVPSGPTPKTSPSGKFALARNKSTGFIGPKELRRRTLAIPSFSFFEEREEEKATRRPNTADSTPHSTLPNTPTAQTNPEQFQSLEDPITFQPRRSKAKRASRLTSQFSERMEDKVEEAKAAEPNVLKELPPIPSVNRRSISILPTRSSEDRHRFSLTPRPQSSDQRHSSRPTSGGIFSVGQGLSNADPDEGSRSSMSRLHPGAFIRKSLTLIGSRRVTSNPGRCVVSLFNRSTTNVLPDGDVDSSIAHKTRSEPCPTPPRRLSASTPALQEPLSTWEILPHAAMLPQSDTTHSTSNSSGIPPLPPLHRHAYTIRPSKSTLRRRSSQKVFQHLNPLTYLSNRDP
jgi:hypothetical protein